MEIGGNIGIARHKADVLHRVRSIGLTQIKQLCVIACRAIAVPLGSRPEIIPHGTFRVGRYQRGNRNGRIDNVGVAVLLGLLHTDGDSTANMRGHALPGIRCAAHRSQRHIPQPAGAEFVARDNERSLALAVKVRPVIGILRRPVPKAGMYDKAFLVVKINTAVVANVYQALLDPLRRIISKAGGNLYPFRRGTPFLRGRPCRDRQQAEHHTDAQQQAQRSLLHRNSPCFQR